MPNHFADFNLWVLLIQVNSYVQMVNVQVWQRILCTRTEHTVMMEKLINNSRSGCRASHAYTPARLPHTTLHTSLIRFLEQ
jgi:hypothetical protein